MLSALPVDRDDPFDPPPQLGSCREDTPIARLRYPDGHVGWLVTSYSASRAVLGDPRFSNRQELRRNAVHGGAGHEPPASPGMFLRTDPPVHTRYRRMLAKHFGLQQITAFAPTVSRIVDERLDALLAGGPVADLVTSFVVPVSLRAICDLMGISTEHRQRFHASSTLAADAEAEEAARARAFAELSALLSDIVAAERAAPGEGVLGDLVRRGDVTNQELANLTLLLLTVGHDTTSSMLSLSAFVLLRQPDQRTTLTRNADGAVEELLRYLTIIQFGTVRTALEDVEVDGVVISAGEAVTVSLPAANRDPRQFRDPDVLDLNRPAGAHLAFGHGVHHCLGLHLARLQLRLGLVGLFGRLSGLRLAVPASEIRCRDRKSVYGVHRLPVTW
ncbi:cytochrome P450 [Amycolatopsis sp. NPDC051903]|uniref:cytochrome P450 n=1 Tax=Amycolatopsis sp. NPDC051903 TaxID=3363936 RepID=UPI00378A4E9A